MIDINLMQLAASLGVGGFLGLIIFLMYRQDRKSSEKRHLEAWRASEERLSKIIEQDQETRQEHTRALTELNILIKTINGRLK